MVAGFPMARLRTSTFCEAAIIDGVVAAGLYNRMNANNGHALISLVAKAGATLQTNGHSGMVSERIIELPFCEW